MQDYVWILFWYCVFLYALLKLRNQINPALITALFSVKVLFTFFLQWVYTYYYTERHTADIFKFFDDGLVMHRILLEEPGVFLKLLSGWFDPTNPDIHQYLNQMDFWLRPHDAGFYNDNIFMIKCHSVLASISGGSFEVHAIFFTFLSFLGMIWLVSTMNNSIALRNAGISIAVLFPSSLIWTSGGLKESVVMFGLGAIILSCAAIFKRNINRNSLVLFSIGIITLLSVKVYVLAFISLALGAWYVANLLKFKVQITTPIIWLIFACTGLYFAHLLGIDILDEIIRKQHDFINTARISNATSSFTITKLTDPISVVLQIPEAFINTTIRPSPSEVDSAPLLLLALENLILICVAIIVIYAAWKIRPKYQFPVWVLLFAISMFVLIGLVTPIFGAIMRYRIPALILLLIYATPYIHSLIEKHTVQHEST